MNVKYVFGPNAGQTCHVPRDQFIDILIKSGVLELSEEITPRVTIQPHVSFGLKQMPVSGEWTVQATDGRTVLYFSGTSRDLETHDFWLAGKGNRAPAELIEAYRAARKRDYPILKGDQI